MITSPRQAAGWLRQIYEKLNLEVTVDWLFDQRVGPQDFFGVMELSYKNFHLQVRWDVTVDSMPLEAREAHLKAKVLYAHQMLFEKMVLEVGKHVD